jgi:tetratricopeptide (TPR) repeat protein
LSDLERYEQLRHEGLAAAQQGRLEEAEASCREALLVARGMGDDILAARALCNLASVEIEAGAGDARTAQLRDLLVRNGDDESCRLAAYHLARYYHLRKENKKALFYARIARERSRQIGSRSWLASSCNQTALLLLSESRFAEATVELERALELLPASEEAAAAHVMENLAYCRFLQGDRKEGFALCFQSLRTLRRLQGRWWAPELVLTFGYLQIRRWRRALSHGRAALAAAQARGETQTVKNALFLLGEAAHESGDSEAAHDFFARLQCEFYPEQHFLPSFLLSVNVSGLVNLKA